MENREICKIFSRKCRKCSKTAQLMRHEKLDKIYGAALTQRAAPCSQERLNAVLSYLLSEGARVAGGTNPSLCRKSFISMNPEIWSQIGPSSGSISSLK